MVTGCAQDVRYTRDKAGRTLYALLLGWPEQDITLTEVKAAPEAVELLGYGPVAFTLGEAGLTLHLPAEPDQPQDAYAFRLHYPAGIPD